MDTSPQSGVPDTAEIATGGIEPLQVVDEALPAGAGAVVKNLCTLLVFDRRRASEG